MRVLRPNTLPRHSRAGVPPSGGSHPGASAPTTDPATTYPGLKALASFRLRPCGASARHVRLKPGLRPWPPTINHLDYRSGSALVITLGLLAVLAVLVFAYAFSARTERFAARNNRDRVTARQYVDLSLVQAMKELHFRLYTPVLDENNRIFYLNAGHPARFDSWSDLFDYNNIFFKPNTFASQGTNHHIATDFFDNFSTNLIPSTLWDEAKALEPHWMPIQGVDDNNTPIGT
ncbi:MAG: hypothetical protein GX826_12990, partial [Gammaproteobacteria bacterium]|nr:hypothetical protein [Gammaproteobacteria bacterium]